MIVTALTNGGKVETWYDRRSRNWVTQLKDADGNQQGDAYYDYGKPAAKLSHKAKLNEAREIK